MHRAAWLVAALLFAPGGAAMARYASLGAPSGYSGGGGPGGSYAAAAGAIANAQASSNFTGKVTKIPAGMKYAAGASRVAARALGLSPLGLGVAAAAWFASACVEVRNGGFVLTCGPEMPPQSTGFEYRHNNMAQGDMPWYPTLAAACASAATVVQNTYYTPASQYSNFTMTPVGTSVCRASAIRISTGVPYVQDTSASRRTSSCPVGWYITDQGCVQQAPPKTITPAEVEEKLAPTTLPPAVPLEIPGVPLPIDLPIIIPYMEPIGDPVKVPNTNPQQYRQPLLEVTGSPTTDDPWRVNVEPKERITESPTGQVGTQPTTPGDPATPDPTPSMCEENPGILACEKLKLGELSADPIKNTNVPLAINADSGFPSGGACPAPKTHVLMGRSFQFSVQPICDFASMIRPLLIGFAWLAAAMTFLGVARREN